MNHPKRYLAMFSLHGLVRGDNIELGRDADTGGQVKYVVELARELGRHEQVARVDLFTRQIVDPKVSQDYAKPLEPLGGNAYIVRVPFGPRRYLRKEVLWHHLESCVDQVLHYFRRLHWLPDAIHGHYADAGYVGTMLAHMLEVPFVFTGHSLGRVKRARLLEKGLSPEKIQEEYNMGYRIEAEERALNAASLVIASTPQEVREQYEQYEHYDPRQMQVIPPGVDLENFYGIDNYSPPISIYEKIARFLQEPQKPMIFAVSRADERKNIPALIKAYGEHPQLPKLSNLVIIAGNRQDIKDLDKGARQVWTDMLLTIDKYDLYGKVAYPKQHSSEEIPDFYHLAVNSQGVFVNPALTEPFGITLIEAAATGLPIIATHDGGPMDIIKNCQNGLLIDPLDTKAIGEAIYSTLTDKPRWQQWSENGMTKVKQYYSWSRHAQTYFNHLELAIAKLPSASLYQDAVSVEMPKPHPNKTSFAFDKKILMSNRALISDIDNTLIGDATSLKELMDYLHQAKQLSFGVATGRHLESARAILEQWEVPAPDVFITAVGTEIYYGKRFAKDKGWQQHISFRWEPDKIRAALTEFEEFEPQPPEHQSDFKISYVAVKDHQSPLKRRPIVSRLRQQHLLANVIVTEGRLIDVLPIRASKGSAVRYLALRWGLPMDRFVVAGDSGNDEEMLKGDACGIVVGNYSPELEKLREHSRIYFAQRHNAGGIIEGLQHFGIWEDSTKS